MRNNNFICVIKNTASNLPSTVKIFFLFDEQIFDIIKKTLNKGHRLFYLIKYSVNTFRHKTLEYRQKGKILTMNESSFHIDIN